MSLSRLAFLAVVSLAVTASAYEDDYLTITGDESVRTNWVGERVVYIFTNTASAATATFKQNMTLQEVLIVGGGGAGGGFKGGGGGGGGVISDATTAFCAEGATFSVTVGKGGIGNASRNAAEPQSTGAGYGDPSSFTFQGNTRTAFGGGGGGSDNAPDRMPSKMDGSVFIGCGGGAGAKTGDNQTAEYYTASQGCCGGTGSSNGGTGGGGGALTPGENGRSGQSGNGGEGVTNSITGVAEVYGSGGGGGGAVSISSGACDPGVGGTHAGNGVKGKDPAKAGSGENGFGAGGGGGGYDGAASAGGDGGSGIVVLAFTVGGQASKPEFDADDIHVAYPNKETQPFVSVLLGGEAGYSATVSVLVGTGDDFTSTNVFYAMKSGDQPGEFAFIYPSPGETFKIKVIASADGVDDTVVTKEVTVPTDQGLVVPSHVGKGGGADVVHVRVGAHGLKDGSNWTEAFDDLRVGIAALLASGKHELWFSGDESVSATAVSISPTDAIALRGGFAGCENTPAGRAKAAKSQLDGQNLYDCLTFDNAKGVVVDGFFFTKGKMHGLVKTAGAGDIVVTNCSFDANGLTQMIEGRAMSLSDKTHAAGATIVDCRISNHRDVGTDANGKAGALYLNELSAATLSDCLFTSNGLAFGTSPFGSHVGRDSGWGVALAVESTPVTVERCDFRANVSLSGYMNGHDTGGLVALRGNCGESVFRNCAWVGNEVLYTQATQDSKQDYEGGVLVVDVTGVSTVAVENCTFAGNLYEGHFATAGLNVRAGTANVKDSIFFANFSGNTCGDISPADLRVQAGATAHVTYTMFGGETNRLADAGGTLDIGVGCVDDDPLFATTAEVYASCRTLTGGHYYYTAASAPTLLAADIHEPEDSPALDTGDPQSPYRNEPKPNGRRVNLGRYGNTPEAMTTKTGLTLIIR